MVSHLKTFINKGCKIAAKNFFFGKILPSSLPPLPGQTLPPSLPPWANFALLSRIFWYCCYYPYPSRDSLSPICGIFSSLKLLIHTVLDTPPKKKPTHFRYLGDSWLKNVFLKLACDETNNKRLHLVFY